MKKTELIEDQVLLKFQRKSSSSDLENEYWNNKLK